MHKSPVKIRFISGGKDVVVTEASKSLTGLLTFVDNMLFDKDNNNIHISGKRYHGVSDYSVRD